MSLPKSEISEILNVFGNVLTRLVDRVENNREFQPYERRALLDTMYMKLCGMRTQEILDDAEQNRHLILKRGVPKKNKEYTGIPGEVTLETDTNIVHIHDGKTVGGVALARMMDIVGDYVVETQLPTAENNYTWYRKYKSGWVEMGGAYSQRNENISFPIILSDDTYTIMLSFNSSSGNNCQYNSFSYTSKTNRGFTVINSGSICGDWIVYGK